MTAPRRREDAFALLDLLRDATGADPVMWGSAIVGFGDSSYRTADGTEHAWFVVGFSPRKAALALYGFTSYGSHSDLLDQLGAHTTGKGCLYVKQFDAVDHDVLRALVARAAIPS